jgi:hypothetical protein
MADLVPHPLVTRVGLDLAEKGFGTLQAKAKAFVTQFVPSGQKKLDAAAYAGAADTSDDDAQYRVEKNDLATAVAEQANLPDLSLFAGFLGGQVDHDNTKWRLLYLDARLDNWLLVPEAEIVVHQRLRDRNAPSALRDALWVRGTATVVRGSGSRATEGRFLVGEFTRAGDFAATTTGGTFSAASGLLCEATTPGCCWGRRSH